MTDYEKLKAIVDEADSLSEKEVIVNAKNDFNFPNQQCSAFWINNHPKSKY